MLFSLRVSHIIRFVYILFYVCPCITFEQMLWFLYLLVFVYVRGYVLGSITLLISIGLKNHAFTSDIFSQSFDKINDFSLGCSAKSSPPPPRPLKRNLHFFFLEKKSLWKKSKFFLVLVNEIWIFFSLGVCQNLLFFSVILWRNSWFCSRIAYVRHTCNSQITFAGRQNIYSFCYICAINN